MLTGGFVFTIVTIALLTLDATAGVTEQDRILAQKIADDDRACAIICNKWDAVVDKDSSTYDKSVKYMRAEMPMIRWAVSYTHLTLPTNREV